MDKYQSYSRFSNILLKNKRSTAGYLLYISDVAQQQLDQLSGHTKTQAYQAIQSLASNPYLGITEERLCVRSQSSATYLVAHDIAVKFYRKSNKVLVDAVKPFAQQHTSCGSASVENTIGALKQELRYLNSLSNKDFAALHEMSGMSGDPGFMLLALKRDIQMEITELTTNGISVAINETPLETAASSFGAVASTSVGAVGKAGIAAQAFGGYRAIKTLYDISKLFGDFNITYGATYDCRSYCTLDIEIKD